MDKKYKMEKVYCVKEKRQTPNVKGTEKVVIAKNNRKLLKVKCASCGKMKSSFLLGNQVSPPVVHWARMAHFTSF